MDKICLGLVQALARGSSLHLHSQLTAQESWAEQSRAPCWTVGVSLKSRRSAEPSEMLLLLLPRAAALPVAPVAGGAGLLELGVPLSGGARCSPWGMWGHRRNVGTAEGMGGQQEGMSLPPRCAGCCTPSWHSSSPAVLALPAHAWAATSALQHPWQRVGSCRGQSQPGKAKAALTP